VITRSDQPCKPILTSILDSRRVKCLPHSIHSRHQHLEEGSLSVELEFRHATVPGQPRLLLDVHVPVEHADARAETSQTVSPAVQVLCNIAYGLLVAWWLGGQLIARELGELGVTRRGDCTAHRPDEGKRVHQINGLLERLQSLVGGGLLSAHQRLVDKKLPRG